MKAIRLLAKDIAPAEVARRLGVRRQSTTRWRKEVLAGGKEALQSIGKAARKRELIVKQEAELAARFEAGAVAAGLPTEAWTLPRVPRLDRERFGIGHHPGHVVEVLAALAMGFSCRRPARRAIERDEEKPPHHWKRNKWPALEDQPGAKGV